MVDPATGGLLQCSHTAPATVAVEAESCAMADALATALMTAPSIGDLREWVAAAARDGALPTGVRRVYAHSRATDELVSFDPHVEGAQAGTTRDGSVAGESGADQSVYIGRRVEPRARPHRHILWCRVCGRY